MRAGMIDEDEAKVTILIENRNAKITPFPMITDPKNTTIVIFLHACFRY